MVAAAIAVSIARDSGCQSPSTESAGAGLVSTGRPALRIVDERRGDTAGVEGRGDGPGAVRRPGDRRVVVLSRGMGLSSIPGTRSARQADRRPDP
ncbi:hypothetical protein GCM10010492_50380 [Saccharothrix mutabilis subsp. mutabilis]|uniref:Uncharacterized protein n=1 Tax=Saccharothrix mutabilis subsp. mutabilis TaxID=66855 RepID=A0ABP3DZS9_9PSEU